MVLSVNIPLKSSEEAIVKFLMSIVFSSHKKQISNRKEVLRHDVTEASKLIQWIINNNQKNRTSFATSCNLVYGNTIVLSAQVSRLLYDAIRAREIVSFSTLLAMEEERKRRSLKEMRVSNEDDEFTTPSKRRRSKATKVEKNDYLLASPMPNYQSLRQEITMVDAQSMQPIENMFIDDDLVPGTDQQYQMFMDYVGTESRTETANRTFVDRQSSNDTRPAVQDIEFEIERPTEHHISDLLQTPRKERPEPFPEEDFDVHPSLKDILTYGRLPILSDGDQRKSLEDEMEEARSRVINSEIESGSRQDAFELSRIASEKMELDENIPIPLRTPKTPRSAVKSQKRIEEEKENNFQLSTREMKNYMEDFSSLHYLSTDQLRHKKDPAITVKELLKPIPFCLRKNCDKSLHELFNVKHKTYVPNIGHGVSDEEDDDEESEAKRRPIQLEDLEPIDLSNLNFAQTPLKITPAASPLRRHEQFEIPEEIEFQRKNETLMNSEVFENAMIRESPMLENPSRFTITEGYSGESGENEPIDVIRTRLIGEVENSSPFPYDLNGFFGSKTTRRDAARAFYATLELLKERRLEATQSTQFGLIELKMHAEGSENVDELL